MLGRVLLVTFQQALRSIVLSLLPITTISLIGWALAGSQTGNTSDPLRASIWFWLAAHLIPFQLKLAPAFISTFFNYLPIAAIILPIATLRTSFIKASEELNNPRAARAFLTLWYGLLITLAAFAMQTETVKPVIYLAPIYAGALALVSTINFSSQFFKSFRYLGYLITSLFGAILLLISFNLIANFSIVKSLTSVVEPGWVGGLLLVFLQIVYLPNLAVAALSYFSGLGFSIGTGTLVTPLTFKLNGIPAIPILGALPSGVNKLNLIFIALPVFFILLNQIRVTRGAQSLGSSLRELFSSIWLFIPLALILGYQSSGTFITKTLSNFGTTWWSLVSILLGIQAIVAIIFLLIPHGIKRMIAR